MRVVWADRVVIDGTGASSSRDGAGNEQEATGRPVAMSEPQPRPAEPSVGGDQLPKEQSDDADMADPDSDRRRLSVSVVEERETKRVRFNVLDGEESDENGWRLKRNGCEFTVVPDEICSLHTTLRADQM